MISADKVEAFALKKYFRNIVLKIIVKSAGNAAPHFEVR